MPKRPTPADDPPGLDKLRRHVRILFDLARIAGQGSDPVHFFDQAVMQVSRALEIDHVKLLRYRPRTADLRLDAGLGWKEGVVRTATFPSDLRSPAGRAFRTAEPVCLPDIGDAPDFVFSPMLAEHGIVSLANVPILIDGAAWGVLEVDSSVHRDFSQDSLDFLLAAAAIIGATVQRDVAARAEAAALSDAANRAQYREVLLRELQHRVKNNFQIILSSIGIQKRRFEDFEVRRALNHITNRIHAISLAHDQLAPRDNVQTVDVASYLRALCASIEQQVDNVAIEVEVHEIDLSIDRAVALGLILNEAATNSVKHAFDAAGGRIMVSLQAGVGYGEARLTVADNGKGIKDPDPTGSGLKLIESLARQLGGQVTQDSSAKGTTTSIVFPVIS